MRNGRYQKKEVTKAWRRAGVIPVDFSYQPFEYRFLLGRNHPENGWFAANLWSDLGGRAEDDDESMYHTAAREAYEESMGLLGTVENLLPKVQSSIGFTDDTGTSFFMKLNLPESDLIPKMFNQVYSYLMPCLKYTAAGKPYLSGSPEGYIEKVELKWFATTQLKILIQIQADQFHLKTLQMIDSFLKSQGQPGLFD